MRLLPIRVLIILVLVISYLSLLGHLGTTRAQTFGPSCETTPQPGSTPCPTNTPAPVQPQPTLPVTAGPTAPMMSLLGLGGAMIVIGGGFSLLSRQSHK